MNVQIVVEILNCWLDVVTVSIQIEMLVNVLWMYFECTLNVLWMTRFSEFVIFVLFKIVGKLNQLSIYRELTVKDIFLFNILWSFIKKQEINQEYFHE